MDAAGHRRGVPPGYALSVIEHFDGSQDPSTWLDSIQDVADLYELQDNTSLQIAKIKLSGPARSWARYRQFADWADFQQQLHSRYGESKASAISRFERCWQQPYESAKDFSDRYLQNAAKAGRVEDESLIYSFTQRLLPELKLEVARQRLQSIEAIVDFCKFWADMNAPLDENRAMPYPPEEPLSQPAAFGSPRGYTSPPKRPDSKAPAPYRPPFRDNTNRAPPQYRPDPKPFRPTNPPAAQPAPAATADAVDELTRKFQRLELNVHHQMHDKDREIRTLRYALKQQQHSGDTINFMEEDLEGEDLDLELLASLNYMSPDWDNVDQADLDQELLASLMVKRTAEDEPQYKGAPAKRAAFSTHDPPAAKASAVPCPAAPSRQAPAGSTHSPPPVPTAHPDAGQLVADKAKKMAAEICRSIKFDGMQEATLAPQAVLTCLAGHLAGDHSLTALGQSMARRVDAVLQGMRRNHPAPAVLNMATAAPRPSACLGSSAALGLSTPRLLSRHPMQVLPKISTCKVTARINGREVECVIDTGASTSAITLDCLRRLNLDSLIDATKTSYLNADGRITAGKGKVPNLVLSMGEFETLINPTVTSALNYNVLIGNDVLTRARAVIDYNQGKMVIQVDPTCSQEVDLQLMNPEDSHPCIAPLQSTQNAASECANERDTALMMTNVDATNAPPYADNTPTIYRMLSDEYPATDYNWVQPAATPCLTAETAAQQPANMKEPRPPSSPKTAWSPTLLTLQEPPAAQFSNSPAAATPATTPPAEPRGMPPGTDPSSAGAIIRPPI